MASQVRALPGHKLQRHPLSAWLAVAAMAIMCAATSPVDAAGTVAPVDLERAGDGSHSRISDQTATEETKAVYGFLKGRTTKANSTLIAGQHMGGPHDLLDPKMFDMNTYRIDSAVPGRHAYPRMIGARYDALVRPGDYRLEIGLIDQINAHLMNVSNIHHPMVSITATPRNPWNPAKGRSYDDDNARNHGPLSQLFLKERFRNAQAGRFWDDIDTIALGLSRLKTADGKPIPVLFRPFAEVNTSDKYYYRRQSGEQFVALWREVADYYVNNRQLHNLIFVWEAWVWNRVGFDTDDIVPWFPKKLSATDNPWVDVVSGAFYFKYDDTARFDLDLPAGSPDEKVFYDLMRLAREDNKPFGAAQWAVNYTKSPRTDCPQGDNENTLRFMRSMDARHYVAPPATPTTQHLSFVYHWGDNELCMAMKNQLNATRFVDDPDVVSITD